MTSANQLPHDGQQAQCATAADFLFVDANLELRNGCHSDSSSVSGGSASQQPRGQNCHESGTKHQGCTASEAVHEVNFQAEELTAPLAEWGALGFHESRHRRTWGETAEIQIVLQSPAERGRGILLMTVERFEDAEAAIRNIWDKLGSSDRSALQGSDAYRALRGQPQVVTEAENNACGTAALLKYAAQNHAHLLASTGDAADIVKEISKMTMDLRVQECGSCPICLEDITAADAVMRCCGAGGGQHQLHHYFHADCLRQWMLCKHRLLLRMKTMPVPIAYKKG